MSTTPLSFDAPSQGTFASIRINLISPETGDWPIFLPLIVWDIFILFCERPQDTHLFCNRVCIGRSKSSKVVDFGTNRNGVCDFLLVINSNFGPIFHRFSDTAAYWLKIPFEFLDELPVSKTRVLIGESFVFLFVVVVVKFFNYITINK